MHSEAGEFCLPMKNLESDIVKLVPFNSTSHAATFFEATRSHPEIYKHMITGPFETMSEFLDCFLRPIQSAPDQICFAIIDKRAGPSPIDPEGHLIGLVTCTDASVEHRMVKISHTLIFPAFHRTKITPSAIALLLRYFLASPADGGLGLLRVQALVSTENTSSLASLRIGGFREEGTLRWHRIWHDADRRKKTGNGRSMPGYADGGSVGRDTAFCWDDWLNGGKERAEKIIGGNIRGSEVQSKL